jgi:UDP:flavonoid glycosyltransferase YjiC (YdhE family)
MARILLAWELGGGLGHLVNLLPFAKGLSQRGHLVFVALRDLSRADKVFANLSVSFLQAPFKLGRIKNCIDVPHTFAHLLHNVGFGQPSELSTLAAAWRNLYDFVRPDLILFEHSPTALLAARGYRARRALVGSGFFCPIDEYPMSDLRPTRPVSYAQLQLDEDLVLQFTNRQLIAWGEAPLDRLSQLYADVDEFFLLSFEELEHYPARQGARYWGALPNVGGKHPEWPLGDGPKVYAYLKPFPALENLLALLNELELPSLVSIDGIDEGVQRRHQSKTLRFEAVRLDLAQVSAECDLAILNGNHFTSVSILLAGKPTLQIPLYLEQSLFSDAVVRMGAGLKAGTNRPEQIAVRLVSMLSSDQFAASARRFAKKYESFDPVSTINEITQRAHALATMRPKRRTIEAAHHGA